MSADNAPRFDFDRPLERKRGVGRGSNFFVLDRTHWQVACEAATTNRLNLLTATLVLLAGTGADHRLTKWSTRACEQHAGMGKPRAKVAIDELLKARIISYSASSTRRFPQYKFAAPHPDREPIFLPMQLVTGFNAETSILRRVRETGDPELLRMLIDLYGRIHIDATHGLPLDVLKQWHDGSDASRKVAEAGVHAVWSLTLGRTITAGSWRDPYVGKNSQENFWPRVDLLQSIGALWFEPWFFASDQDDAEPLFPIDSPDPNGGTETVSTRALLVALLLTADQPYRLAPHVESILAVLPTHHTPPAVRGVAKLRVEADTPGRRNAFGARMGAIRHWHAEYQKLHKDLKIGLANRPIRTAPVLVTE